MRLYSRAHFVCLLAGGLALAFGLPALAGEADCGKLENAFGPFDYVNIEHRKKHLDVVENYHFSLDVEMLARGKSGTVLQDLDYTLRAFPNHHRALHAMARYQLKKGKPTENGIRTIECYLDRAKRMNPRDAEVPLIEGWYLHRQGNLEAALDAYRASEKLKPVKVPSRDYQMGMLLFDMKRYDDARRYADRAYSRKYPDDELRERLKSVSR